MANTYIACWACLHNGPKAGMDRRKNGELLKLADAEFDLFITSDQGIQYQQNLGGRTVAVLQLSTNKIRQILKAKSLLQSTVDSIQPGEFFVLDLGN